VAAEWGSARERTLLAQTVKMRGTPKRKKNKRGEIVPDCVKMVGGQLRGAFNTKLGVSGMSENTDWPEPVKSRNPS